MGEIMVNNKVKEKIDLEIKKVWLVNLRIDYDKSYIFKEDSQSTISVASEST